MSTDSIFKHDAMMTTFCIRIAGEGHDEAAGAAKDCFEYLDYLESKLSRFLEGSDIWQINHMKSGDSLNLSEDCYNCLLLASEAYGQTGGLFDISLGTRIQHLKEDKSGHPPGLTGQVSIDPDKTAVHCIQAGRELDLGGIGKGFALDRLKERLQDWGIQSALLSAGASTFLAFGEKAWPVELTGDHQQHTIELKNTALSASGTGIQGNHIVSPDGIQPNHPFKRLWTTLETAAMADAWSTALMLLPEADLIQIKSPRSKVFAEHSDGSIHVF
jgi:thiamine biosynthesis lipoprotein